VSEFDDLGAPPGHTGQSPKRRGDATPVPPDEGLPDLSSLTDEELAALGREVGVSIEIPAGPRQPITDSLKEKAGLVTAASLLDPDHDPDEGDFEPGLYKGFAILPRDQWPRDKWTVKHEKCWGEKRFYVQSGEGTPGLVPWPGSQIVWPWERAWTVDLYRETVTSFLKEEKKPKAAK
jgi:hypothetical protein